MLTSLVLSLVLAGQTPGQPEPFPRLRLADYLPPIAASEQSFEEARAFVGRGGQDDLPWTSPQVEMTAGEDLSRAALSVAFNWVWLTEDGVRRPVWFARLRAMSHEGVIERFADSRLCPGVEESLRQIDALPALSPRVPGLPEPDASPDLTDAGALRLHDNSYGVRLRGLFDGARYSQRLEVSGGSDGPLAPLVADALTRLRPCWTETPPPRA